MRFKGKPRVESFLIHLPTELLNNVCAGCAKDLIQETSDREILFRQRICRPEGGALIPVFSVQSLCPLCLCGCIRREITTESQRTQRLHREEIHITSLSTRTLGFWNETRSTRFNRKK